MNAIASEKVGTDTAETPTSPIYKDIIDKALEGVDVSLLEEEEVRDLIGSETVEDETQESDEEDAEQISEKETDSETEETPADTAKGKSDKTKGTSSEKLPGIDVVLRELDKNNPSFAKVVRGLQRDFGDYNTARKNLEIVQNQTLEMQKQLKSAMEEIEAIKGGDETSLTNDPNNPLNNVRPEERELFKRALAYELKNLGVKTATEQEIEAQAEYVSTRHKDHASKFGDSFGMITEDGRLVLSPAIKPKLEAVRDRLASNREGVTWSDLHILAMHDEIVKAEVQKALNEFKTALQSANGRRVGMLRKAETVDGSVSSSARPTLKPAKGESPEAFRRRVFDLTWAKLPSLR